MPPSAKLKTISDLYDRACQIYGRTVPERFKDEAYRPILTEMVARNIESNLVDRVAAWTEPPLSGMISDCFSLPEIPRKLYRLDGVVGNLRCLAMWVCFIPQRIGGVSTSYVNLLCRGDGGNGGQWARHILERRLIVCAKVLEEKDLAYDIRTWDPLFISACFQADMLGLSHGRVRDMMRTDKVFQVPLNKRENLVRIRTINPQPSRSQEKKMTGQGQKQHRQEETFYDINIDGSESAPFYFNADLLPVTSATFEADEDYDGSDIEPDDDQP